MYQNLLITVSLLTLTSYNFIESKNTPKSIKIKKEKQARPIKNKYARKVNTLYEEFTQILNQDFKNITDLSCATKNFFKKHHNKIKSFTKFRIEIKITKEKRTAQKQMNTIVMFYFATKLSPENSQEIVQFAKDFYSKYACPFISLQQELSRFLKKPNKYTFLQQCNFSSELQEELTTKLALIKKTLLLTTEYIEDKKYYTKFKLLYWSTFSILYSTLLIVTALV